jgi:gliding motility-associated-like protein
MVMPPSGGICDQPPSTIDTVYFSMVDTTAGNTYLWAPGGGLSCTTCESPKAYPTVTTVYTITVTGSNGCAITLHDTVISGGNPLVAKITGRDSICSGALDTLYASGGAGNSPLDPPGTTYSWSNGATTSSIIVHPTTTTPYTVFITSGTGACSASSLVPFTVNVFPRPHFTIESPDSICSSFGPAIITVSPPTGNPNQYFWYGPPNGVKDTDIFVVKPAVTTTYTLAVKLSGCTIDSAIKIKVNNPPAVVFTGATNLCSGASTTICAFGGDQYHWSTGQTTSCVNVIPPASITYTVGVWLGACPLDTTFTIIVDTMPKVKFSGDTSICAGDSTTIHVQNGFDYTYLWNTGATADSIVVGSLKNGPPLVPGKYTYYLTVTKGACSKDSEQIVVKVYPRPKPVVYPIDTTVCEYDSVTFTATGGDYYLWSPKNSGLNHYSYYGNPNDTDWNKAAPAVTTNYGIKVCTWGCCRDTGIRLNIIPNVQGAKAFYDTTVSSGTPVNLLATFDPGPYAVEGWTPATGLSCTNCPNPTATDTKTTTYVVTFMDLATSCMVLDSVTVTIFNCNVFVPNVFSPNGDGINDKLYVRSLCMKTMDFAVFDRFGNKVFETEDQNSPWDGTYHGKPMEIGTYMWYLSGLLSDGVHVSKSGNVTLVR